MKKERPLVSVCVQTYNQEDYIGQCLDGIVMQETNFDFEIIVGEDDSSDRTRAICKTYQEKYPELIRLFLRKRKDAIFINGHPTGRFNFVNNLKSSKGKYIAICEGDDYWTDPKKLQKQVDFLEANEDFGICFHRVQVLFQKTMTIEEDTITRKVNAVSTMEELAKGNFIHTPSVMITNDFKIPKWFLKSPTGDWTLYMLVLKGRKIKKLTDTMTVYRKHDKGIWSGKTEYQNMVATLNTFSLVHDNVPMSDEAKANLKERIDVFMKNFPEKKKKKQRMKKRIKNILRPYYHALRNEKPVNKQEQLSFFLKHKGYCHCCEQQVTFIARKPWLRDYLLCDHCKSIPRERALMKTIMDTYPNWKELDIHESSPIDRGHSVNLKKNAQNYTVSQYFPNEILGATVQDVRNEDLEQQTFSDESFDVVVTSDVMEHIYDPEKAFKEIHRTLKPGGAHIFSVPLINRFEPTERWANKGTDGEPIFLHEPEWHGNPVDDKGSPVTMHWGYDIIDYINKVTGAQCKIVYIDDLDLGIRAEFREIIIAKKKG